MAIACTISYRGRISATVSAPSIWRDDELSSMGDKFYRQKDKMGSISELWSEAPWEQQLELAVPMWHKSQVPCVLHPNKLHHVDVWVPNQFTPHSERLASSWLPHNDTLWIIYIHGGAWRDPLITSESFAPTLKAISPAWFESRKAPVAFASIGYSLSPYPEHPTCPSSPSDYSRNASHPKHIQDVLEAIFFLQQHAKFGNNYILAGHSCGATLAFQAAMNPARWGVNKVKAFINAPIMVLGLNGLYNLLELTENPGGKHNQYIEIYAQFITNAFDDDRDLWALVSPALIASWATEWPNGRHVMLVQSHEDTLVPFSQGEKMRESLIGSKTDNLTVELVEGHGDHDDIWKEGTLFAEVLVKAIEKLSHSL